MTIGLPAVDFSLALDRMIAMAHSKVAADLRYTYASTRGDSPIEKLLVCALHCQTAYWPRTEIPVRIHPCADGELGPDASLSRDAFYLCSQVKILDWRVDYVLWVHDGKIWRRLIIECDGHDFHERTKEQAARDRDMDRRLQSAGETVFRFTGAEIFNEPLRCADTILRWADKTKYSRVDASAVEMV